MNRFAPALSCLALLLAVAAEARSAEPDRKGASRMGGVTMQLLKVEERSITAKPTVGTEKQAPTEQAYTVDPERTRVFVGEVTAERRNADGQTVRSVTARRAGLTDLKAGQIVRVAATDGVATRIDIMPPAPPPAKDAGKPADKTDGDKK